MTKLGAQLYTLRDFIQTEADIRRSLKAVSDMGYKTIQVSGMGKIDPHLLREICDSLSLKIAITHNPPDRILFDTDALIKEHDILGCDYIGLGGMPTKYQTPWWIENFKADFTEPAKKISASGKLFMYHNHAFEFVKFNGKRMLETLMEQFSPDEMGFTLDTYWVQAAGGDVCYWLEQLKGRTPCIHLKDMTPIANAPKMAPVGEGNMNFPAILKKVEELGGIEYALVEQDECQENPFVCLEKSYKNCVAMGLK